MHTSITAMLLFPAPHHPLAQVVSFTENDLQIMRDSPAYMRLYEILSIIVRMNGCPLERSKFHVRIFADESTSWHVSGRACDWTACAE